MGTHQTGLAIVGHGDPPKGTLDPKISPTPDLSGEQLSLQLLYRARAHAKLSGNLEDSNIIGAATRSNSRRAALLQSLLKSGRLSRPWTGAGEGNRTLVCSLGSCRSTIELRPRAPHR